MKSGNLKKAEEHYEKDLTRDANDPKDMLTQLGSFSRFGLAIIVIPWVRDSRLWSEQLLADRLQLFFGQQTGFQGGFAVALLAGSYDDVQVSGHIVDQALDWSQRDTAHGTLSPSSEGFVFP
jgi:hypothetical protein